MIQRVLRWSLLDQEEQSMTELLVAVGIICFVVSLLLPLSHRYLDISRLSEAHIWSSGMRVDYHLALVENDFLYKEKQYPNRPIPSYISNSKKLSPSSFSQQFNTELFYYPTSKITWQLTEPGTSSAMDQTQLGSPYQWLFWRCQLDTPNQTPGHRKLTIKRQIAFASMLLCPLSAPRK